MSSDTISFLKKVKLALSLGAVTLLYGTVIALLIYWKEDLAVLSALLGTALGWALGTLLSPFQEGEIRTFKEVSKILSAFLGGIVLSKVGYLVDIASTDKNLSVLFNRMVVQRVMVAAVCLLVTMMVVFVSRQYFQVDEPNKNSK
jgi:hypothetical protein